MDHEQIAFFLRQSAELKETLAREHGATIAAMAERMVERLDAGGKLLFCGNGGSAGDSQHLATEFVVRLSASLERPAIAALALTTDSSLLTACANDYGFERIFSRQLEALARAEDLLVCLSTSGNSANVIQAAREARRRGLAVVGLLGGSGGALRDLCDPALVVPSDDPGRVQECHITVGHILAWLVEREHRPT